jgi:hypothetical protein
MSQHTPGPWVAGKLGTGNYTSEKVSFSVNSGEWVIADVWADATRLKKQAKANAHLNASAPDLLIEIKHARACLHDVASGRGGWAWEEVLEAMDAAIAKAEGRA